MCIFSTLHVTKSIGFSFSFSFFEKKSTIFEMCSKTTKNLETTRALCIY
jgi:hypothetical protein